MKTRINFTQFLRPDGRRRPIWIEVDLDHPRKPLEIEQAGYRLEAEELTTGEVSLTVYDPITDEDVAMELCENGPAVLASVRKLIEGFAIEPAEERERKASEVEATHGPA